MERALAALSVVAVVLQVTGSHEAIRNLLLNPSFEDASLKNTWKGSGFQMRKFSSVKTHGNFSLLCSGRTNPKAGPQQHISGLVPGGRYALRAYVRLLQDKPGKLWQTFKASLTFYFDVGDSTKKCKVLRGKQLQQCQAAQSESKDKKHKDAKSKAVKSPRKKVMVALDRPPRRRWLRKALKTTRQHTRNGTRDTFTLLEPSPERRERREPRVQLLPSHLKKEYRYIIAWRAFASVNKGWLTLTGDLDAPMRNITGARLSIQGPDAGLDFLLDDLVLHEVPEHPDWATEALVRIDKHRKSNVQLHVHLPHWVDPEGVEIQVDHKKHLFAFGSKVEDDLVLGTSAQNKRFQDIFFYLFNWATVQSYKWKYGEGKSQNPDFSKAVHATDVLLKNGLKVRGHSILWAIKDSVPRWVQTLRGRKLRDELVCHVERMTNITRGKLAHWDVQNEFLHEQYYEETLQDPNITMEIFKLVKRLDPVPKLYLNDFQAVTTGGKTEAYHDLAEYFKTAGTGIQGLGIQGHTKDFIKPDPTMIWRRLDRLAQTGLELFMTEFDLGWHDDVVRADWLEDAIRAFFAHPGLSGLIFWDIWDVKQHFRNKGLISGPNLQFIEPGQRFACLVKKEWSTHVTWRLSDSNQTLRLRAFQGLYDVVVKKRGVPVQKLQMNLGKQDMVYHINVTASNGPIDMPKEIDFVPQCISHRDQESMGVIISTVKDQNLMCVRCISSAQGSAGGLTEVSVTCDDGYVMTDCSSYVTSRQVNLDQIQLSDKMTVINGTATCTAHLHGMLQTPAELVATAQCCRLEGLMCDYRVAGPSAIFDGARAEAVCPSGYFPFGCSAYSRWSHHAGVMPSGTSCVAQSGPASTTDPAKQSGVIVTAACCYGRLKCHVVQSHSLRGRRAHVTCSPNYIMTGCNAFALDGKYRGDFTERGTFVCTAVSETGVGVTAYATCCTA